MLPIDTTTTTTTTKTSTAIPLGGSSMTNDGNAKNNPFLSGNMMLFHYIKKPAVVPGGKGKGNATRLDHKAVGRRVVMGCTLVAFLLGVSTLSHSASQYLDDAPPIRDHHRRTLAQAIDRTLLNSGLHFLRGVGIGGGTGGGSKVSDNPGKYLPISCDQWLKQIVVTEEESDHHVTTDDNNKSNNNKKQIGNNDHPFWVALNHNNEKMDSAKWDFLSSQDYYERSLMASFVQVIRKSSRGARILDVGGDATNDSGLATFLAASVGGGVAVDTFEPNDRHRRAICETLRLNQWRNEYEDHLNVLSTINLYSYRVGRTPAEEEAQGGGSSSSSSSDGNPLVEGNDDEEDVKTIITLDQFAKERGWFDSRPNIAVLKVGTGPVEDRQEHNSNSSNNNNNPILGAVGLLRAQLIRNIFMEVSATSEEEINYHKPALRLLALAGYKVHKIGGWRAGKQQEEEEEEKEQQQDTIASELEDLEAGQDLADKIIEMTLSETSKHLHLQWTLPN